MRITSALLLASTIFSSGCQSPNGGLDWHRVAMTACRTAITGGGLLVGGPLGAGVGSALGNGACQDTAAAPAVPKQTPRRTVARSMKKPAPTLAQSGSTASPHSQNPDVLKPAPADSPAAEPTHEEPESLGI